MRFHRETWFYYKITQRVLIKSKINIRARSLWWLANIESQMFIELSQLMAMALSRQSINASFRILERPKMMEDLPVPQHIHDGVQVPSFNPKPMTSKTPPILHGYTTRSKGRPTVHSLSTTIGVGSSGLRPAPPQRVTFCSRCTGNSFWI